MRRILTALALLGASAPAMAAGDDVCVRNYLHALPSDPDVDVCERIGTRYVHAQPQDEAQPKLCVITFADTMCDTAPREYRRIKGIDGASLCVVDFNQPGVINYCDSVPQLYDYARVVD